MAWELERHDVVKLIVNRQLVELKAGSTLLDAAGAAGVHISTLCYHPRLPAHAVCRICLVDIKGQDRPLPACVTLANEDDVVETETKSLQDFRTMNAQWLLARHPNDCLRCEVNGLCCFQNLVNEHQGAESWPSIPMGPTACPARVRSTSSSIWRGVSKFIECGLCVDACGDAGQQQHVIGLAGHGSDRLPVTVFDLPLADTLAGIGKVAICNGIAACFAARDSQRFPLMRLLDAVDRRGAEGAASLFHPKALRSTGSSFDDAQGAAADIEALVATRLPPRKHGPRYARHRMASAANADDLTVITPEGERCTFEMHIGAMVRDGRTTGVSRSLARQVRDHG